MLILGFYLCPYSSLLIRPLIVMFVHNKGLNYWNKWLQNPFVVCNSRIDTLRLHPCLAIPRESIVLQSVTKSTKSKQSTAYARVRKLNGRFIQEFGLWGFTFCTLETKLWQSLVFSMYYWLIIKNDPLLGLLTPD